MLIKITILIIVVYLILIACQVNYLFGSDKEEDKLFDTYKHIFSFKTLYKETDLNKLGVILYLLIQIIFFLPAAVAYFIYWLCHKKEK